MTAEAQSPSMTEVRKFLKEADSYDHTLSEQEMLELYQVLQDSQKTATEEYEQRRIFEQTDENCSMIDELRRNSVPVHSEKEDLQKIDNEATEKCEDVSGSSSEENEKTKKKEKPFIPKKWSQQKKQANPVSDMEDQISSTSIATKHIQQKQTEEEEEEDVDVLDIVDVFNCVPTAHKPLKRISLSPKYIPPFYCNPKVIDLDYKQRACMISNYHLELLQKYNNYQRQSIFPAPWGKAVQSDSYFNGNLMKKIESLEENTESSQDNVGLDELLEAVKADKSSDEDFEMYVSKSGRQTKRKLYKENVDNDAYEWKKRSKRTSNDEEDVKKIHPKKRRIGSLSKEETMKRSKLFADNTNSPRTEKIFGNLADEDVRKKEAERKMEKFNETLDNLSGEEVVEDSVDVADIVHSEEPFARQRVVPPSYTKKTDGAGRNKPAGRPKGRKNSGSKKSSSESSSQETFQRKYDPLDISTSTSDGSSKKTAACPVCFEEFFQSELMEHTPVCLDTRNQNSVTTTPLDFCKSKITCELCDEAFTLDLHYEEHTMKCLRKHVKH